MREKDYNFMGFLFCLAIAAFIAGAAKDNTDNKKEKRVVEKTVEEDAVKATPSPTPTLSPEDIENQRVLKLVDEYLDYIEGVKVTYPNEKYYPSEKQIEKILKKDETYKTYEHKDTISMKELFKKIKKNSKKFVKENKKYEYAFYYDCFPINVNDFSLFENQTSFEMCLEDVLKKMKENANNDFKEDICKMEDLKIVFGDLEDVDCPEEFEEPCYGNTSLYKKDENLIIIDYKRIGEYLKESKANDFDVYKEILNKELSIVRRNACKHRLNQGQEFDEILGDSANIKNLFGDTIKKAEVDSSYEIEKLKNLLNSDKLYFPGYKWIEDDTSLIFLLGLFNGKTYEEYSNAILDSNPDAFYDFCGAKTKEEKAKLYKILTAIDAVEGRNNIPNKVLKDFTDYEENKEVIRYNYRLDIFSKVLKDMINYTASYPEFSLENNITMFGIVKRNIINDTDIIDSENKYDKKFILGVNELENKYLEFLNKFYSDEKKVTKIDLDANPYISSWNYEDFSDKFPLFGYVCENGNWNDFDEYRDESKKLINK